MKLFVLALFAISLSSHAAPGKETRLVFLGDSITEGYGIDEAQAFPALVEKELRASGRHVKVTNSGISGATSASGPSRMKWLLKSRPHVVFLELGANDGLRGVEISATKENLRKTIKLAKEKNTQVVLVAIELPPNYGADYRLRFANMFGKLAKEEQILLLPFLKDFHTRSDLKLDDGLHPNPKGHEEIAKHVLRFIKSKKL